MAATPPVPRRYLTSSSRWPYGEYMTTTNHDWALCLAWSLGHAILTALVGRTAVNVDVTYDALRVYASPGRTEHRWVGRCKACKTASRVDGRIAAGRRTIRGVTLDETIVVSGTSCYRTADQGSNATVLFVSCQCTARVKLQRVFDDRKPNRPRHECNAKCLSSTGPSCECKCKGANHGASASAA